MFVNPQLIMKEIEQVAVSQVTQRDPHKSNTTAAMYTARTEILSLSVCKSLREHANRAFDWAVNVLV